MSDNKSLCLELLHADTEDDVVSILQREGYWNNPDAWRLYGDRDGNYATIGNQQSRPDGALAEKITNAVDARLMNECLTRGIHPESNEAPTSIRRAVWEFIEDHGDKSFDVGSGGTIQEWSTAHRTEEARKITIAATGRKTRPCITIADVGEGQTPDRMPDTFLSIERSNKLRIPFVQGKYNMGGTGVIPYCGNENLQLIITRRNPAIVEAIGEDDPSSEDWGFTVVRRKRPGSSAGSVRNSMCMYLAPIGSESNPSRGQVLRFQADSLPLMPEYNDPYVRGIAYGSALKLYDYQMKGFASHVCMKDGLLYRLDTLLPDIALPVSIHECRDYRGDKQRSFVTTLSGLTIRLEQGRGGNLEDGFPDTVPFAVHGYKMVAKIYAFQRGKAETYRTNQGVLLTINGQTHGYLPKTIFGRKKVKLGRLADSLLVTVDCSEIPPDAIEDLFMANREKLREGELGKALNSELEEILRHHEALKELANKRRGEEVADRLKDSKPLEDVLQEVMKMSPALKRLFQSGQRLSRPFKDSQAQGSSGGNAGSSSGGGKGGSSESNGSAGPFQGRPHPSFFRFRKMESGATLNRDCEQGRRARIKFETDVENGYFARASLKGHYDVEVLEGRFEGSSLNHNLTLHDGVANWSVEVPSEANEGDALVLQCVVNDETLVEPFCNVATLIVKKKQDHTGGGGRNRDHSGSKASDEKSGGQDGNPGSGGGSGGNEPEGIAMPEIDRVRMERWGQFDFDENSASTIREDDVGDDKSVYTFHVNIDNVCLQTEMKYAGSVRQVAHIVFSRAVAW